MRQINPYPVALGWHAHTHSHAQRKNLPLRGQRFFGRKNTNFQLKTQDGKTHSNKVNAGKGVWKTLRKGQGKETQREKDRERERHTVPAIPENRSTSSSSSPSSSSSSSSAVSQTRPDQSRPNDYPSDTAESCPAAFDCSSVVSFKRNTNAFGRRPAQIHKPNKISTNYTRE